MSELTTTLATEIKAARAEALSLADQTKATASNAIKAAIRCGQLLITAKEQVPYGGWMMWVEEHCGCGTTEASKYMRLANFANDKNLEDHASLRQAYIAAGILPDPQQIQQQSRDGDVAKRGFISYVQSLRGWWAKQPPVTEWRQEQREQVKEHLRPLVEFYNAL